MDETGYLDDKWEEAFLITEKNGENKIVFTQKDIREIQLAKAAMRAGMEVLLKHSGIVWDQVDEICLAGGFGFYVDLEKTISPDILPEAARNQGNGKYFSERCNRLPFTAKYERALVNIAEKAMKVGLAEDKDFQNIYVEEMYFPEID